MKKLLMVVAVVALLGGLAVEAQTPYMCDDYYGYQKCEEWCAQRADDGKLDSAQLAGCYGDCYDAYCGEPCNPSLWNLWCTI